MFIADDRFGRPSLRLQHFGQTGMNDCGIRQRRQRCSVTGDRQLRPAGLAFEIRQDVVKFASVRIEGDADHGHLERPVVVVLLHEGEAQVAAAGHEIGP